MNTSEIIHDVLSRNPPSLRDKSECYALYNAGIFGNKVLSLNSYSEIIHSGWKGGVCMRSKKGVDRKKVVYDISLFQVKEEIEKWKKEGHSENDISFNQSMPNDNLILQGEVMRTDDSGLFLLYTTIKKPMNIALKEKQEIAQGLSAKLIIQSNFFPSSYSDLESLLEMFPDSAVEFSAYNTSVGNIPNRNVVVWEVRNY